MANYTSQIKEKTIDYQKETLVLKVQMQSDEPVIPFREPEKILEKGEPEPRFPTIGMTFRFDLPVTDSDVKNAIKAKAKMISDTEALDLPLNVDL